MRTTSLGASAGMRGFTMIELITVMILVGIMAAYAAARLDVSSFRERGFHDGLKGALQYARKAAVAKRRQVCVDVNTAVGVVTFSIAKTAPEAGVVNCPADTALALPGDSAGVVSIATPDGVTLSAGSSFYFDALGRASAAITFSSTGQPDIVVAQETGYVR